MPPITTIVPAKPAAAAFAPTWDAALATAQSAPAEAMDEAIDAVMDLEEAIDAAPVITMRDAVAKLRLALTMAGRLGADDDPAWVLVSDVLAFLDQSSAA